MKNNSPFHCKECLGEIKSKHMKEFFDNFSPEEKEKWAQRSRDAINNLTDEQKSARVKAVVEGVRKYWVNGSEESKSIRSKKISDKRKEYLSNDENKKKFVENAKNWRDNISEEEKKMISDKIKAYYNNLSDEELSERMQTLTDNYKKWYHNLSNEEKADIIKKRIDTIDSLDIEVKNDIRERMSESHKQYWAELPEDEKKRRINELRLLNQSYWDNISEAEMDRHSYLARKQWEDMSINERMLETRRKLLLSNGHNKFHDQFESAFKSSILNDSFYYVPEVTLGDEVFHSWDYGIYDQNGTLSAVVDLDGAYFHADECDYDGLHSRMEYDVRRSKTVHQIPIIIIQEKRFDECFQRLVSALGMTFNEYTEYLFRIYRAMPFPTPSYTDRELIRSYNALQRLDCNDKYHQDLSVNTRLGDRIIYHFQPTLWANAEPGWYDDKILREWISHHTLYQTDLNRNKILQNLTPNFISPGKAKMIISRYLLEYNTVFDPSGSFGILLGATSLNKKYIGIINDEVRYHEINKMISWLSSYTDINTNIHADDNDIHEYPCLFSMIDNINNINELINRYKCMKYVFVSNHEVDTINKSNMIHIRI